MKADQSRIPKRNPHSTQNGPLASKPLAARNVPLQHRRPVGKVRAETVVQAIAKRK